ncbi:MAG TPA: hypothetical protein VD836_04245 [Solirubrobacteraceae bacterium]|nr:hypothetical protein [Solirubrobacteraceae bacterium]
MPLAIVVSLALLLVAPAFLLDDGDGRPGTPAPPLRAAPVGEIAARVEAERGLRFARAPAIHPVSPAEARAEAAESLDEDLPPARREAEAQVLAMLGLLPPGFDLGEAALGAFDSAVAGYYDPRSGALRVVEGAQTGNRVLYETTVAHELTHALEDEVFDFDLDTMAAGGDRALAYSALVEGSATAVMTRYMTQRFGAEETLGATLGSALAGTGTEGMPPFLTAQLIFPYTAGQQFVARLLEVGGGGWDVVDSALRFRPPASTEQILHPRKYLAVEQPERVAVPRLPGWERRSRSTLGEWSTARVLARAGGTTADDAAAGWGGDALALYSRPGGEWALGVRWRWDSGREAGEFLDGLRAWADEALPGGKRSEVTGGEAWTGRDGIAVVRASGDEVALGIAPDLDTARALALPGPGR